MNIKVCDFGFSRIIGQSIVGFPERRYLRHNLPMSVVTDFKNDIFAIGSLLYEILEGKPPYNDLTSLSIRRRYISHVFPKLEDKNLHGYEIIIKRSWEEHYRSMDEMEMDLPTSKTAVQYDQSSIPVRIPLRHSQSLPVLIRDDLGLNSVSMSSSGNGTKRRRCFSATRRPNQIITLPKHQESSIFLHERPQMSHSVCKIFRSF
jgi:serine/threonine protein kinase